MATAAQINANRMNAQASTGPVTDQGKSRSSRNSLASGLFSRADFVLEHERPEYEFFCDAHQTELAPEGIIEQTLVAEIIHAAWTLRRCRVIRGKMNPHRDHDGTMATIDASVYRARATAERAFHRCCAELRKAQTERHLRAKLPADAGDPAALGLASCREVDAFLKEKPAAASAAANLLRQVLAPPPNAERSQSEPAPEETEISVAKRSQSEPAAEVQIPRGAPCPCGSGEKFKRCCGRTAPPVLSMAA